MSVVQLLDQKLSVVHVNLLRGVFGLRVEVLSNSLGYCSHDSVMLKGSEVVKSLELEFKSSFNILWGSVVSQNLLGGESKRRVHLSGSFSDTFLDLWSSRIETVDEDVV